MKRRVYVDMDGVLCDYCSAFKRERPRNPAQPYCSSTGLAASPTAKLIAMNGLMGLDVH
jgi:hypothetical protein